MIDTVIKLKELKYKDGLGTSHACYTLMDGGVSQHYYTFKHCANNAMVIYDIDEFMGALRLHGYTCEVVKVMTVDHPPMTYD